MLTKNDMDHLQFIYDRLRDIHGESPRVDYMLRLGQIIDGAALQTPPREIPAYQPPPDPMIANRRYDNMKIKLECRPIEVKERKLKLDEDGFMRIMWGGQVVKVKPEDFFRNDQDIEVAHGEDVEDMLKKALESEVEKELTAEDAKVKAILIPKLTDEELILELARRRFGNPVRDAYLFVLDTENLLNELTRRNVKADVTKDLLIKNFAVTDMLNEMRRRLDADPDWRRSWVDNLACLLMDNHLWKVEVPEQGRVYPTVLAHDKCARDEIANQILTLVFGQKGDTK